MAEPLKCDCCRKDREAKGNPPRPLLAFAAGIKGGDLYLCEYCDGEEIIALVDNNDTDPLS